MAVFVFRCQAVIEQGIHSDVCVCEQSQIAMWRACSNIFVGCGRTIACTLRREGDVTQVYNCYTQIPPFYYVTGLIQRACWWRINGYTCKLQVLKWIKRRREIRLNAIMWQESSTINSLWLSGPSHGIMWQESSTITSWWLSGPSHAQTCLGFSSQLWPLEL